MEPSQLIAAWRICLEDPTKSWVLFEQGTCVVLKEPEADLAVQAIALLREHGPVLPGTSLGDFGIITLDDCLGWVVTSHHNDILTFVGRDEIDADADELVIGLLGRSKRGRDTNELVVVHVEDNTAAE